MEDPLEKVQELMNKPCWVLDMLPQRVEETADSHFFDVECYLLNREKRLEMKNRYVNILLKLMCYYRVFILWDGWNKHPKPEDIEGAIGTIMENCSGTLHVLFLREDALLIFAWDCLHLSLYNGLGTMLGLAEKIALSEGFFCWPGAD